MSALARSAVWGRVRRAVPLPSRFLPVLSLVLRPISWELTPDSRGGGPRKSPFWSASLEGGREGRRGAWEEPRGGRGHCEAPGRGTLSLWGQELAPGCASPPPARAVWLSHPCLPGSLSVLPVCVRPPASLRTQSPSDPGGPSPALGPALDGGDWLTGLLRVCGPPLAAPSACGGRGDGELRTEVSLEETLQDLSTPVPRPGADTGHALLALPGATHTAATGPACLPALLGRVPRGWGSHLAAS